MSTIFLRHPAEDDLALFAGGELGPLARWRIEGHLDHCDRCRQAVGEFFELRSKVMDLGELPHVDWTGMAANIHRRVVEQRQQQRPWANRALRLAWAPAVALLVLLAVGGYVSRRYAAPAGAVLDASAGGVELRMSNDQVLTLLNASDQETPVNLRVGADAVSARYVDRDTGHVTVTNVYAQ